ncbi:MAG: Do family serine endopeptidase [bacterium]
MKGKAHYSRTLLAVLFLAAVIGLVLTTGPGVERSRQTAVALLPQPEVVLGSQDKVPRKLLELQNTSDAFVYVAKQILPTVVSIQSTRIVRSSDLERFHDREDLKDLFRFRFPKKFRQQGSGSGIIISSKGHILTNVHVVDRSEKLLVTLYDNREFDANIVGADPLTEVAVIKIDAADLPVARLGSSEEVKVGQWVLAIGNPLELRSTVTAGIISAKERQIDIIRDTFGIESFLQTDAAINPGNSGGPLVNLRGEVIGVNTAIATESGYNAGFGFAIPIDLAKKIMADLIHKGSVERGYLGIGMRNIDEKMAKALHLDRPEGVFISEVLEGGPAVTAGIKSKDVLVGIGNHHVNKSNQVQAIIATKSPGDVVRLSLIRKGKRMTLDVTLGENSLQEANQDYNSVEDSDSKVRENEFKELGLRVKDLSREDAARLNFTGRAGVLITEAQSFSPADEAGLLADDILIEIDDVAVENGAIFHEVVAGLPKGSVSIFTIVRNRDKHHVFVEIPGDD